ncbi:MAG: NADPH-dependent FMN reductase, partial [Bacteroidia bacterium]|nr:NADPH-dependent FMN reductase [Bacteroidia bacterium]
MAKIYANILKNRGVDYEEFSLEQLPKTIIADELYDNRTPGFELII